MAKKLTKQQIQAITDAFKLFDKNGDGSISVKEVHDVLEEYGNHISTAEVQGMINEVDKDGNGSIEIDEFIIMMARYIHVHEDDEEGCKEMHVSFHRFDKDNNGFIDALELMAAMRELGTEISKEDAHGMISIADTTGDGRINYEEFKQLMRQLKQS